MPATIVATGSTNETRTNADGTVTLSTPSGAAVGDLEVLWVGARGTTTGTTTIDRPTGWTRLGTTQAYNAFSATIVGGALFYRIHDGSASTEDHLVADLEEERLQQIYGPALLRKGQKVRPVNLTNGGHEQGSVAVWATEPT